MVPPIGVGTVRKFANRPKLFKKNVILSLTVLGLCIKTDLVGLDLWYQHVA
jgi:hypothetical protein